MKVALIQAPLVWENPDANRKYFSVQIDSVALGTELIVLPEMFSTGFTMHPEKVAAKMQDEIILWMQSMAHAKNCAITGSIIVIQNDKYYNRLLFVAPSGVIQTYDKRHLFSLAGEDQAFTPGKQRLIIDYNGWRICPLICYDLRFPVFSRNTADYDLLLYVANWPKPRINAWDALLKARAIENMCYVIGVNRVGQDANGHEYPGHSQIIDPLGNEVLKSVATEAILYSALNLQNVREIRNKFCFLQDRDHFTILD